MPPDVEFRPTTMPGTGLPAREAKTRGPQQEALTMAQFGPPLERLEAAKLRTGLATQHAEDVYEQQADVQLRRQEALERVAAKRAMEMEHLRQGYMQSVQQAADMKVDSGRLWANSSTVDKIGALALAMLGGPKTNAAIQKRISDDVEAQKLAYDTAWKTADSHKTAYAMALEQFGSEDAAEAHATAAGQLAAAAKVRGLEANWRGTETATHLDMVAAQLEQSAFQTAAAGFKFVPATAPGRGYEMVVRGQRIPGIVSEKTAQEKTFEHGVKPAEQVDLKMLEGGIQMGVEDRKQQGKADEGAKFIASQLQSAGVPQARAAAERALQALNKSPGSTGERVARAVTPDASHDIIMPEDSNAREQAWQDFANQAMKATMGNVTASEEVRATLALGRSPSARKRAIGNVMNILDEVEKNTKSGASPGAQAEFERRREAAQGGRAAAPAGAKGGW